MVTVDYYQTGQMILDHNTGSQYMIIYHLFSGSTVNAGFNNVHLLHMQGDPVNPYFALNKQSRTLQNKIAIDTIQVRVNRDIRN